MSEKKSASREKVPDSVPQVHEAGAGILTYTLMKEVSGMHS